ncbi:unnamed protein product (macronuclear) [Paramecium tetraurelia]|uniref:Transmembrane protein n=1 Tax=Paramecium tetraurelia TaxID=5888 RepID=A0DAZ0_PARTE|nr:uncharacterized protein GSPATT00015114001 [Paramecium tetraurelia]CAK80207.1 unnamed protein product [Paramecium tetraurelia]|eukprot:XP_001447604.1 hypothetical protein (macronuclear) [Paramecium tetraurelia strain d4-2]
MSNNPKSKEQNLLVQKTEQETFEFSKYQQFSQNQNQKENVLKIQQGIAIPNNSDYTKMQEQECPQDNLIHQKCFSIQKMFVIKVLVLFFFWSLFQFFLIYALLYGMREFIDQIAPYLFPISLLLMCGLAKIGTLWQFRRFPENLFILIFQVYLSTQTYLTFCRLFNNDSINDEDGISFSAADLVFVLAENQFIFNCVINLILILYFAIEQETIRIFIPIAVCCIFGLIPLIFNIWLFINSIISVLYGSTIMIVIGQIVKGRFMIQVDNIIAATNILFFGLILPVEMF